MCGRPHYNLDLQSIAVNGRLLQIDQSLFVTSNNRGIIIDSGTTLAYLIEEAYDPLVQAVTAVVAQSTKPLVFKGGQCYKVLDSVTNLFPPLSFNFAGGASMMLRPDDYLVHMGFVDSAALWCIGFQKVQQGQGVSILGGFAPNRVRLRRTGKFKKCIIWAIIAAMVYHIWQANNSTVWRATIPTTQVLINRLKYDVKARTSSILGKRSPVLIGVGSV